jgi:N-acyl-L-homoserine lactone synthetase
MSAASSSSSAEPDAPGTVALDRLARRLLSGAPDLRVAVAAGPAERDAVHRLRYEHVVAAGWASAAELAGGVERDAHDQDAVHVGAWDGGTLAGAVRVVLPRPGRPLPVEEDFGVVVEPLGRVVEVGRLVIAGAYRGDPAHRLWGALFGRAWLEVRARGFRVLAGAASGAMVERLRALGLPFEVLGPARAHWGEPRHPVRLDPAGGRPGWYGSASYSARGGSSRSNSPRTTS